jgi:hypothetical protein
LDSVGRILWSVNFNAVAKPRGKRNFEYARRYAWRYLGASRAVRLRVAMWPSIRGLFPESIRERTASIDRAASIQEAIGIIMRGAFAAAIAEAITESSAIASVPTSDPITLRRGVFLEDHP